MDRIFGGSYPANNPDELLSNQPVSSGSAASLSPYLNFDPKTLSGNQNSSQFLTVEGETQQRGSFERAFSLIGSSMIMGASWKLFRQMGSIRKKRKFNVSFLISRVSPKVGKTGVLFGLAALQYSMLSVFLEKVRGQQDVINGAVSGTAIGVLKGYKAGPKILGQYAALGLLLGVLFQRKIDAKKLHEAE